jgi:ketosteroid isomerase-like protein
MFKLFFIVLTLLASACSISKNYTGTESDRKALEQTSIGIRTAFAQGNVPAILSYHHPEVIKALGYTKYINGYKELEADLKNTLNQFNLVWKENNTESLIFHGETAVEMTAFTIEGTPKGGGNAFIVKGRAMIVYVRYKNSPTGWASIRELIQPDTE